MHYDPTLSRTMKKIITILSAILLTLACGNVYAQKNSTNDYNLKKAHLLFLTGMQISLT